MPISLLEAKRRLSQFAQNDALLVERLNFVCEELLTRMTHKGTLERAAFTVTGGTFTLPWYFSGCVGVTFDRAPRRLRNQWWEVIPAGPGKVCHLCSDMVDLGDGFVVFKDLTDVEATGCFLKVISSVEEEAGDLSIRLKGLDANSEVVRTQDPGNGDWIDGEIVELDDVGHWSATKFMALTQVVKPETDGRVSIYASATSGDASPTLVAIYQPRETDPCWRRYRVPAKADSGSYAVDALCQVRHRWIELDDELLTIGSYSALRDALMGAKANDEGAFDYAEQMYARALRTLLAEQKRYHPQMMSTPSIQGLDRPTRAFF